MASPDQRPVTRGETYLPAIDGDPTPAADEFVARQKSDIKISAGVLTAKVEAVVSAVDDSPLLTAITFLILTATAVTAVVVLHRFLELGVFSALVIGGVLWVVGLGAVAAATILRHRSRS